MENDLGPPAVDAMMTSEKRIEIGTTVALLPFTGSNHLCLENHMQGRTQLPVCTFFNYHFLNFYSKVNSPLGCVILPKVLELISPVDFPIPLPMNKSPSEKKSNLFHF